MKVQLFLVFLLFFLNGHLIAQSPFEQQLRSFLSQPEYRHASVGIQIIELESGETVFETNGEKLLVPASVLKLVTSAAALEILGSGYRFQTRLGYTGNIKNGTLKGDLVIVGGGDPALGSEYFPNQYFYPHFLETWAQRVKASGINRVEGNLVLDGSLYGTEKIPPTWVWEDMGNYYGAGANALTVYDNFFRFVFRSPAKAGQPTEIISVKPKIEDLDFKNEVVSSDDPRDLAYIFGSPLDSRRTIRGTIPKNRNAFTIKASNPFPEKLLADDFMRYLAQAGVFIAGEIKNEKVPDRTFQQIELTESPPLSEIIKVLNRESVNLFAEHLVKQIAAEKTGTGDREAGLKAIGDFWKDKGLETGHLFMEDGSGLSHFNAVSPAFLASVLRYMEDKSPNSKIFFESLPEAGQGTLFHFNPKLFPENTLRLKSGSMTRVRCYAGYLHSVNGKKMAVAVMVNHFSGSPLKLVTELEKLFIELRKE